MLKVSDQRTKDYYDENAESISELHKKLEPTSLYNVSKIYLIPNGSTLDLGCGIGRDTSWLIEKGFKCTGVDNSEGMLKLARTLHPDLSFLNIELPMLSGLEDSSFDNIFSCAVLQHVPENCIEEAVFNITRVLKDDGVAILSFRGTNNPGKREGGRLYECYRLIDVYELFLKYGCTTLYLEERRDERGMRWSTIVIKKGS